MGPDATAAVLGTAAYLKVRAHTGSMASETKVH